MVNEVKNEQEQFLRMTVNERIQHFLLLTSFIVLVITGFALKFPELFIVSWVVSVFGEGAFELRGDIHRIASVVMVAVGIYHIFFIAMTKRGKKFLKDMLMKKSDLADLRKSFSYFLGKTDEKPRYGRFSYIEKMEYWAVIWGTVIMGLTGMVLWFENTFLPIINVAGMDIATAIHFYEAILATFSIIVWHFYFVFLNPDVYPMNKAWFTGLLTREQMKHEHPLELEEIEKDKEDNVNA